MRSSSHLNAPSRRRFLKGAGLATAAAAAFTIVPRHVLGGPGQKAPSEKLNIAGIGIGGMGAGNLTNLEGENIVALCDVNRSQAQPVFDRYKQARQYEDFREMLEKEKDLDAVLVATPDHTHAVTAMACMKKGLHVYVQKPLAHSFHEVRTLTEAARQYKVQTQMGNQGNSGEGTRLLYEWVRAGAIGHVREIHAWASSWCVGGRGSTDVVYNPRDLPTDQPPVPAGLNWDLWLGPTAPRPYHPAYLPCKWRGWRDFGSGFLGDFFCHMADSTFWALDLGAPDVIEASSTQYHCKESHPLASKVHYHFPARGGREAVRMTWYDGGLLPERPAELDGNVDLAKDYGGVILVGDEGKLMAGCYGEGVRLIPESKMKAFKRPEKTLRRVPDGIGGHERDWVRACKTGEPANSNLDHAGPLTEIALLGVIAIQRQTRLEWDAAKGEFTNDPEANKLLKPGYREGWSL